MPDLESLKFKIVADSSSATSQLIQLSKTVEKLEKAMDGAGKGATKFSAGLGITRTGASSAKSAFKGLGTAIGDVKVGVVVLAAAVWKLKDAVASCVKQSMDFVETMNLFNVSMGDNAFAAGEFAEKVQQAFGIDMAQWMRNQGVFQTLIEGFGVASEKADVMSQNLTQLGYDLSSLFNLPFADSMQKLQSGIAGELEPLRRLGYDLSQAKLQQIAYDHGIQQSISTMTQAEKSQLRYYAIMTQVTTAHGDMARTIMQPANMLRVFKENVVIAARSIGNLLIPVMQALLSVAIVVARGIAKLANMIASLFGIKTDWRGYMDDLNYNGGGGIEDIADDIDDVGGAAGGATKKIKEFKKQFLGFDKINNITLPTEPSSGGGSGGGAGGVGGGDFDLPLPTYDFLRGIEDAFAKAHPKIQKLFDDLAEDFKNGGNNIGSILGEAIRYGLWTIDWDNIKGVGNRIAAKIADGLNDFLETPYLFLSIGETIAESLNTVIGSANTFAVTFHWESLGTAISQSINGFFSKFDFALAGQAVSNWTKGILSSAINAVDGVDWSMVGGKIAEFLRNLDIAGTIEATLELAVKLIGGLAQALGPIIEGVSEAGFNAVLKLTVDGVTSFLDWVWKICTGDENAEFPIKIKAYFTDERTEAIVKILQWLQKILLVGTTDIPAAIKIAIAGPGEGVWDKLFGDEDIEKNAKINLQEGKLDSSLKKNGKERKIYDHFIPKMPKIGLDGGTIASDLKGNGTIAQVFDKFKNKSPMISLIGGVLASTLTGGTMKKTYDNYKDKTNSISLSGIILSTIRNAWAWFKSFFDKTNAVSLAGNVLGSIRNAWDWFKSFYNKSSTTSLYGSVTNSIKTAWDWFKSFFDKDVSVSLKGHMDSTAQQIYSVMSGKSVGFKMTPQYEANGGVFKNGHWRPVTAAAGGGAFNTGQMFIAREAGPELVGTIGGHTAVMNNNQIVSSVAAGVASANSTQNALLQQLLSAVQGGSQEVALEIDGTRFGTLAIRSINRVQRQQGRVLLNV